MGRAWRCLWVLVGLVLHVQGWAASGHMPCHPEMTVGEAAVAPAPRAVAAASVAQVAVHAAEAQAAPCHARDDTQRLPRFGTCCAGLAMLVGHLPQADAQAQHQAVAVAPPAAAVRFLTEGLERPPRRRT